jgi:hypothetical protein
LQAGQVSWSFPAGFTCLADNLMQP